MKLGPNKRRNPMSNEKEQNSVFNTGTGGFITIRNREGYIVYEFTQQTDAETFLSNNAAAKKKDTKVKLGSVWTDGKWVSTKTFTYTVIVHK
jgi:hypothetical protein